MSRTVINYLEHDDETVKENVNSKMSSLSPPIYSFVAYLMMLSASQTNGRIRVNNGLKRIWKESMMA
jgi:hypothetical protein